MPSLTSRVEVNLTALLSNALDFGPASFQLAQQRAMDLANGAGASQGNVIFHDQRTIAPSGTDSLDLIGGGLLDALGAVFAPARLRAILIYSAAGNLNNLTLYGDANHVPILNTAATTKTLKPGGIELVGDPSAAGIVVTAGTGDILKVVNAAGVNSVTYDIFLIGSAT